MNGYGEVKLKAKSLTICITFGEIYILTNFCIFLRVYIMILLISDFIKKNYFFKVFQS